MPRTFEELVSDELDTLYQGALFLSGGNGERAERLLVNSITLAFEEQARDSGVAAADGWMETRLVRSFLTHEPTDADAPAPAISQRGIVDLSMLARVEPQELFAAASTVPARPRAALWLVLLRRWAYDRTAEALDVAPDRIPRMLEHGGTLIEELAGSGAGARRAGGR